MTPEEFDRMVDSGERKPYVTTADTGYFVCDECGEPIKTGDFIVRFRWHPWRDRTAWHYNCDDPTDVVAWAIEQNKKNNEIRGRSRTTDGEDEA